jgi:molybdopterin synthase sulfur carrier subunit
MALVRIPSLMRDLTGGLDQVRVEGRTLGEVIAALEAAYPGVRARLMMGDRLDPAITAWVDGRAALRGLRQPVSDDSEIMFLPAVAGG